MENIDGTHQEKIDARLNLLAPCLMSRPEQKRVCVLIRKTQVRPRKVQVDQTEKQRLKSIENFRKAQRKKCQDSEDSDSD
jgi:hypothetical protein